MESTLNQFLKKILKALKVERLNLTAHACSTQYLLHSDTHQYLLMMIQHWKLLINKSFEYIKKCQTEKTDIDLIGEKDFDICNHFRRKKLSTTLAQNIIDDFCLNVSLFEAGYRNLDKKSVYEYLDDSIGVLLDSGAKIKIRLLTQKSVSYGSEFMSLVSTTEQSEYIFDWLK